MRLLLVPAAFLILAAPASATVRAPLEPLPGVSVGRVDGTRAFIAASVRGDRLRVYVCDGTLRREPTISTWFRARWDGRRAVTLASAGRTLRIRPSLRGRLDGHRFRLRRATMPAGLFRGHRKRIRTTWIVLANGHKRGTFASPRPPKCRVVLVTTASGSQWVAVCG